MDQAFMNMQLLETILIQTATVLLFESGRIFCQFTETNCCGVEFEIWESALNIVKFRVSSGSRKWLAKQLAIYI